MNCEKINNKLLDYIDKTLNTGEKEEIESHLQQCNSCKNRLNQFKRLNEMILNTHEVQASKELENDFTKLLESKRKKILKNRIRQNLIRSSVRIAASILIFVAGSVFGIAIQNYNLRITKISNLESQLSILKQQVAFEMLSENKTASKKLSAITLAAEQSKLNEDIAAALYNTLITDENSSVRIEAATTLQQFSHEHEIKKMLIHSLQYQSDPVVQIKLIQILSGFKEQNSNEALKIFFQQENILPIVKEYGQSRL